MRSLREAVSDEISHQVDTKIKQPARGCFPTTMMLLVAGGLWYTVLSGNPDGVQPVPQDPSIPPPADPAPISGGYWQGCVHTVRRGDTLGAVVGWDRVPTVAKINGLTPPYVIYPGQVLQLCKDDQSPQSPQPNTQGGAGPMEQPQQSDFAPRHGAIDPTPDHLDEIIDWW